ncbi:MAG: hypothetical protein IBX44_07630 [Sulfurospirillum sp.]|nr:hypothetical protein [Sulfurospirillum sp.]
MSRTGSSLIELIIAIVVMGIAIMSLPLVLSQSQNSNALALQQEAILATKTKLGYLLSYDWDANSYDANASLARVLDTTGLGGADNAFDVNVTTDIRRAGHVNADKRRRLWDVGHSKRAPLNESAGLNDIDDFHGVDENMSITSEDMDFMFNITLRPSVAYLQDSLSGGNYNDANISFNFDATNDQNLSNQSNIKMITVSTIDTASGGDYVNITLRAFASNIGQNKLAKREW